MILRFKKLLFSSTSKDTLVSFVGLGMTAGLGTLFTILMARALEPSLFGIFSALAAIVALLSSMGDLGISSALVNFLPKVKDKREVLVSVCFWLQIIVALGLTLVLISLGIFNQQIVPGSRQFHFVLIGFLTGIYVLQGLAIGLFNAEKKFLQAALVQSLDSGVKFAIVVALFWQKNLNIELALLANIFSTLVSVTYGLGHELEKIRPIFPRQQLAEIFRFAKWIALSRAFGTAISRVDVILLNLMVGSFQTGIYAAASRITLVFALLVSSIGGVIAPRFSSFQKKEQVTNYLKKVTLMVSGVSAFMFLCLLFADPLVRFVFGEKYLASIPVFQALTLAMIPFLFSVVTIQPLIYTYNQPHFFARITIIQVLTIIVLDLLLIPRFQALAPAISLGAANLFVIAASGWKLSRLLK